MLTSLVKSPRVPHRSWAAASIFLALLLLAAAPGCGLPTRDGAGGALPTTRTESESTLEPSDEAPGESSQGGNGNGGNEGGNEEGGNEEGGGAPGAPIKVPARVMDQGRPLVDVLAEIETGIREQCGGKLCLEVEVEERDIDPFTKCDFVTTEPPQRSSVPRGSTVVVVAGAAPCEESPEGSESSSAEESVSGSGESSETETGSSEGALAPPEPDSSPS